MKLVPEFCPTAQMSLGPDPETPLSEDAEATMNPSLSCLGADMYPPAASASLAACSGAFGGRRAAGAVVMMFSACALDPAPVSARG